MNDSSSKIVPLEYDGVFAQPWSIAKLFRLLSVFGPAAIVALIRPLPIFQELCRGRGGC
jgi:hypothetical protein